jgi:hypothetical protein
MSNQPLQRSLLDHERMTSNLSGLFVHDAGVRLQMKSNSFVKQRTQQRGPEKETFNILDQHSAKAFKSQHKCNQTVLNLCHHSGPCEVEVHIRKSGGIQNHLSRAGLQPRTAGLLSVAFAAPSMLRLHSGERKATCAAMLSKTTPIALYTGSINGRNQQRMKAMQNQHDQ